MMNQLDGKYDPKRTEDRIYRYWTEKKYFHADADSAKTPYTIVIPPPNITGRLHMGHALDNILQDVLIRWRRMQGYEALWLPGTDHASIATEAKIVEAMRKEGLTKEEVGRERFLRRAWDWKEEFGGRIIGQLKRLGCSCDWDRERFTLDEGCSRAVQEVFRRLYGKGLIYRGERIVNWCPHCLTSISDAEVEHEDQDGFFWHLRYPFRDGDGYVEIATTRPETLLGDTAVAVNPKDGRYADLVGRMLVLPLVGREIPVIADEYVDMEFGTGAVKITPAHDPNDFEVGRRHSLPVISVLTEDARVVGDYPEYAGMDRYEARAAVVRDLEKGGFLVRTEKRVHSVGVCYRCGATVEPRVSLQWFVRMGELAGPAIEAVRRGDIRFVPERFEKNYFHWMENIRDWCISRQLWWGHRIPAYYCDDCGETVVSAEGASVCPKCGGHMTQDPDTLDTWFSSALWPFSTLGWPEDTPDFRKFYPTSTLVTAYDIITFWVSRMIFSALEYTGKIPFDTVLIHGLVRDSRGRKMSKSLGNGVDPLDVVDRYGADALRFMLLTGNSPGNDTRYTDEKATAARNFANKIWNAARFIQMNLDGGIHSMSLPENLTTEDRWVLHLYGTLVRDVTENLEKFEIGVAAQKLYDFIWDVFCDWYIELAKARLRAGGAGADDARRVLVFVMGNVLKLLHPFMPFITETIWQSLPHEGEAEAVMTAAWPVSDGTLSFPREAEAFGKVLDLIRAVRNRRTEMNVPPARKAVLYIETGEEDVFRDGAPFLERLAAASDVRVAAKWELEDCVQVITDSARALLPMAELTDPEKERARLCRERERNLRDAAFLESRLANPEFLAKAPPAVVENERERLERIRRVLAKLEESLGGPG